MLAIVGAGRDGDEVVRGDCSSGGGALTKEEGSYGCRRRSACWEVQNSGGGLSIITRKRNIIMITISSSSSCI